MDKTQLLKRWVSIHRWMQKTTVIVVIMQTVWCIPNFANAQSLADDLVEQELALGQYVFKVQMPAGFSLELLTANLELPRVLHFAGDRLFIGSRSGYVYWLDPPYSEPHTLIRLSDYPNSIVIHEGALFIAQTNGIYTAPYSANTQYIEPDSLQLLVSLPDGPGHDSRTLKIGPDNHLYVSLGLSANCSDQFLDSSYPDDLRRGGIATVNTSVVPAELEPFAAGLRNPVGFDWHPQSGQLYVTNNGPDHLGYEQPPEYFSSVDANSFHGMPWYQFNGIELVRDRCITSEPPVTFGKVKRPVVTFPARAAPMDMVFVPDHANAQQYVDDAIVALHGSWATDNGSIEGDPSSRREPKLVRVAFDTNHAVAVKEFVSGFQLSNGARWARPMGVAVGPDGDIYFTSDAGIQGLFRLRYNLKSVTKR